MGKNILNKNVIPVIKGDKGDAGTIQVGEVVTLPPGSSATITNKGTASAAILDFGIPKGDGLAIKKWYVSTEEMSADFNNPELSIGDIVGIDSTLAIYMKGETEFIPKGTIKGAPGIPGTPGENGTDGTTFIPAVSPEGVLSWTNDDGKENPPSQNIKGADGISPRIGSNGNWFIGDDDTNVLARGTNGEVALVYGVTFENASIPQVGNNIEFTAGGTPSSADFNRAPELNDIFLMLQYNSAQGRSFLTMCKITAITPTIIGKTMYVLETTGTEGADGVTFTPTITDGVLTWENNGNKPNPEALDLKQLTKEQVELLTFIAQNAQRIDNKVVFSIEVEAPSFNAVTE